MLMEIMSYSIFLIMNKTVCSNVHNAGILLNYNLLSTY